MKKKFLQKQILFYSPVIIGFFFCLLSAFLYYKRVSNFLFFDEYANIIAGYFMTKGRMLYTENFFNHQMLPAYLSYLVQVILKPQTLYQLISYHRLVVIVSSFSFGMFIIFRLRWVGLGFVIIFELMKYYFFGNLFLAESMIVYPFGYLCYLAWLRVSKLSLLRWDYLLAAVAVWFVVFSREPYVPLAIGLYLMLFIMKPFRLQRDQKQSLMLFLILTLVTLLFVPLQDYLYQVGYVNYVTVFHDQLARNVGAGLGLPVMVFYPFYVFFMGSWSLLREMLIFMSSLFLLGCSYLLLTKRSFVLVFFIISALTLANVRVIVPGTQFYSSFYQMQWFALIVLITLLLIERIFTLSRRIGVALSVLLVLGFGGILLLQGDYFIKTSPQKALFTYNYDKFYITGQAIKVMAEENSTLFVDLSDSLMYWTAGLPPAIETGVYYPVMHDIPEYRQLRLQMFSTHPPDFYYTNCNEGIKHFYALPKRVTESYAPVQFEGNPSCLFVKKTIATQLSADQLKELQSLRFSLASEFLAEPKEKLLQ